MGADSLREVNAVLNPALPPLLRARLTQMWCDVVNAGGAAGFAAPVTLDEVRPVASTAFDRVDAGTTALVALVSTQAPLDERPGRTELGALLLGGEIDPAAVLGWLLIVPSERVQSHWGTLARVQIRLESQGRGLGLLLVRAAMRAARVHLGYEALALGVREGSGTEKFYLRCGFQEIEGSSSRRGSTSTRY
jgi:GNAT superfamily N-acetyltransferase